jgi:hypothetical protein
MADKFLPLLVKDIISNPAKAWETINSEIEPVRVTRNNLLFPLIILVSASAIAGSLIFTNSQLSPVYSVLVGIRCFFLFYIAVYASAFIIKEITYSLDLGRSFTISFRLIVYSLVPFLLCQFFSRFFESLLFVNVLAFYGLYIFWTGSEKMLNSPSHKKIPLLIASFVTFVGIYIVINLLFKMLTDKIFFKFFS